MKKLYIGNIAYRTTEKMLQGVFASYETVKSVSIVMDKISGQSRGFGFVELSDEEAKQVLEEIDGIELDGKVLQIKEALPPRKRGASADFRGGRGRFTANRDANSRSRARGGNNGHRDFGRSRGDSGRSRGSDSSDSRGSQRRGAKSYTGRAR